jgi:L-lactate dehydrogenase (cytochrome)/(S)-mandelate dehydrogenase
VLVGPTGFTGLAHWSGDLEATRAGEHAGTRYALSTASSWSLEEGRRGR